MTSEDYGQDDGDCTAVAPSRAITASALGAPESVCTLSRVGQNVDGGVVITGLFN